MKAISAAAILITAKAAEAQQYNPYNNRYNPFPSKNLDRQYHGYAGTFAGRYDSEGYGHYVEPVRVVEPVIERHYIPQIVPSCEKICARAEIKDAWEGNLGNGQFGTHGEVTMEQTCNSKVTVRGQFENLRVPNEIDTTTSA